MSVRRSSLFGIAMAATLAIALPAPAIAGPAEDYAAIERDYESWLLGESPEYASALGVRAYDGRISDISLAAMDRRAAEAAAMLARLDSVPADALTPALRTNRAIMHRQLSETVEGNRYPQRMMLFTTYAGWHQSYAGLGSSSPFSNAADYRSYIDRLAQYPALSDEAVAITARGVSEGHVLPCVVLGNIERSVAGLITETPEASRYYAPFTRTRPVDVDEAGWTALQAEARRVIAEGVFPALARHRDYLTRDYLPSCTAQPGISAQPSGADYYAFRIRQETTTGMSAEEIHQLGLSEVARIRAEMAEVAARAGFASREAFIADLRTNPVHYARTPEELMMRTARITRTIDGHMPRLFGRLPRLPYTLREIPAEIAEGTTTAYYSQGGLSAGIAGTYYVNTSKLDQRPLWEIPSLSLHEAVPGHHHQISLQQELDIPMWRRNFTGFTAFVEGWALYAERLGIEMGLYDTPATNMGRLSYEMWRACRLVVDTGIHAKGWSKDQAVAFMRENSALSEANIDAEVNRYISWPGQALGYKIGELRIRALRERAERELGARFDIRTFHDAVLAQGAVPLDVLEAQMGEWIASQVASAN